MADNFKTFETSVDDTITNAGGAGSILAADHNSLLKQFARITGKYTGAPYKARRTPNNGVVPAGVLFLNGNAFNTETDFVITFAKNTADLNDVGLLIKRMTFGSLIRFKDYAGRSVYFTFKSFTENQDTAGEDIYEVTVSGFAENSTYNYSATDDEICVVEFLADGGEQKIVIDGVEYLYRKNSENGTKETPAQYDIAEYGVREVTEDSETFNVVETLIYNTGTPSAKASWEVLQSTEITF